MHVLKDVIKEKDEPISKKAQSLYKKVELAYKKGTKVPFPEEKTKSADVAREVAQIFEPTNSRTDDRRPDFVSVAKLGAACLTGVFVFPNHPETFIKNMLKSKRKQGEKVG
jgi:uncharacterized protein with ATP-grasp and redox domains